MTPQSLVAWAALAVSACNARFAFDVTAPTDDAGLSDAGTHDSGLPDCDNQCFQAGQSCDPEQQVCVECLTDSDCSQNTDHTRCTKDHHCVSCISDGDCQKVMPGAICIGSDHECRIPCTREADDHTCSAAAPRCGTEQVCAECDDNQECVQAGKGKFCLDSGICAGCRFAADCPSALSVCDIVLHQCVACSNGSDCPSGYCDLTVHECGTVK